VASPGACGAKMSPITLVNAWPSWIDVRRQYILLLSNSFLPFDAIQIHSAVLAIVRCLSVRLSVTRVTCIQAVKDIIKFLFLASLPYLSSDFAHPLLQNSKENPLGGSVKYTGDTKFSISISICLRNGTK